MIIVLNRWATVLFIFAFLCSANASLLAQGLSDGLYSITSKSSGFLLDGGASSSIGGVVDQHYQGLVSVDQEWEIASVGAGRYRLVALGSGLALSGGGAAANGNVTTDLSAAEEPGQMWTIKSAGKGLYQFVNAKSDKALDNGGYSVSGSAVTEQVSNPVSANQQWALVPITIGAITPFTTYEAESATLEGGAIAIALKSAPDSKVSTPELEASGHAYIHLSSSGQSVTFTNSTGKNVTAINLRFSIPDSSSGDGTTSTLNLYVDDRFRQTLHVSSAQTWVYEGHHYNGMSNNPADGLPHVFWDEMHTFIEGAPIASGSRITLRKDPVNTASFYNIDLVELEKPPQPLAQEANSLSISTDCGAVANDPSFDSTSAIQRCIDTAQRQGNAVWIPVGRFYLTAETALTTNGVTIAGAGMWYSTLYSNPTLPAVKGSNIMRPVGGTLRNFEIDGNAVSRDFKDGNRGAINIKGNNWIIDSLWIHHEGAGIWGDGVGGLVENCRLNNTWADGINLNNGNGGRGNDTGNNLIARNNFVRGSGDDGFAINEEIQGQMMNHIVLINNTSVAPWWANNIGIYGGVNDLVVNNLVMDSVRQYGISIGIFTSNAGLLKSARVEGNTVLRGGSLGYGNQHGSIGVGVTSPSPSATTGIVVRGNTTADAMFDGVRIFTGDAMILSNNTVDSPGTVGILIDPSAKGSAILSCNTVKNAKSRKSVYIDRSPRSSFTVSGSSNVGFAVP